MSIARKLLGGATAGDTYVDDVFSTYVYAGEGGTKIVTNGIDLDGKGGMVWIKDRTYAFDNLLYDTERGVGKGLSSNLTTPENNDLSGLSSFNNNGFKLGSWSDVNYNGHDFVSWTWRKSPKFFDVVTYVGNGQAGQTISHNLKQEPGFIIVKGSSGQSQWRCYHRGLYSPGDSIADKYMLLNENGPVNTTGGESAWNNVFPTSTEFTAGFNVNASGSEYVAYLFAHDDSDEGMIQCGSYTGNQTAGKQIDLGFEPQFVLIKASSGTGEWYMFDTMRGIVTGGFDPFLRANMSAVESGAYEQLEVNPTGFSLSADTNVNTNGVDYIYMAIRRPNKPAEEFEADELFAISKSVDPGGTSNAGFTSGFPVDLGLWTAYTAGSGGTQKKLSSRLTQGRQLRTDTTIMEEDNTDSTFDHMGGWCSDGNAQWLSWMWRRAPGYFDTVTFKSEGSRTTEYPHNLQVVPEMVWVKCRTLSSAAWHVWHKDLTGPGWSLRLDDNLEEQLTDTGSPPATYTDTYFTVGGGVEAGGSNTQDYIAYLWASVPGICDIGSYTGNGTTLDIDCGFTNGVRFILIKRTDVSGNWTFWDTERGISSGDDPFLALNNTGAQTKNLNCLSPLSSGVTVKHPNVNTNGGTYIYMAIA